MQGLIHNARQLARLVAEEYHVEADRWYLERGRGCLLANIPEEEVLFAEAKAIDQLIERVSNSPTLLQCLTTIREVIDKYDPLNQLVVVVNITLPNNNSYMSVYVFIKPKNNVESN